jgi:hypothetical protein
MIFLSFLRKVEMDFATEQIFTCFLSFLVMGLFWVRPKRQESMKNVRRLLRKIQNVRKRLYPFFFFLSFFF